MSRKCILLKKTELNWEAEQEVVIEAIGPFDNWDSAGEWREYLGEPLSNEYVIVKLKSAVSKQKELDKPDPSQPHWPNTIAEEDTEDAGLKFDDHLDEIKDVERMNKVKEGKE